MRSIWKESDEDDRINVLSNIARACIMTQKYEKSKLYCEMLLNKSWK
ncbi:hypothetical protein Q5M85_06680 [Paraclostridium bifermentans]|nr:hypothetical protein [Paraclostridium bifermentans]